MKLNFFLKSLASKDKILSHWHLAFLLISAAACNGITEEVIEPEDIISLMILDDANDEIDEKIGNGNDLIKLRAKIFSNYDDEFKSVTFKTSGGDFVGVSENATTVLADNIGIAETMLRLPLETGELFLSAEIKGKDDIVYVSEKSINLTSVDEVVDLDFKALNQQDLSNIPRADGNSQILIEGTVLVDAKNLNSITFNASEGIFQQTGNNEIKKSRGENFNLAVVYNVPQKIGPVFFSVKTGESIEYSKESNLIFERAHAEEIFIEPATLNMNSSSGNIIVSFLTRNSGKVSLETSVDYEAFQLINDEEVPVGRFTGASSAVSDSNGEVTATFFADTGDVDFLLPVTIRVSTNTDSNDTISTFLNVNVSE